jgi:uncharacterized protein YcaQ
MDTLSASQARRIALAAQGFMDPRPTGAVGVRHARRVLDRVGLIQIDSVNVLQRAHYFPMFSRLGNYPTSLLDRAAYRRPQRLFEYWGHEASLLPVELHPLMRWRMARDHQWSGVTRVAREQPKIVEWVRDEVRVNGPLTAAEVEADAPRRRDNWGWNWSDAKAALEWLFWRGEVLVSGRSSSFARVYDIPERVLPASVLATPTPTEPDAIRALVELSARAMGVANEVEIRDYFRLPLLSARQAIRDLVDSGVLIPVDIGGERNASYLFAGARIPRRVSASALVSPFDPIVWNRGRTQRIFDFNYRIEIYVPAPQRVFGYYVLPFLLGDRFVARVDLKADRQAGVLRVPGAFVEPGAPPHTASALAAQLVRLAEWLGLERVDTAVRGDLAGALNTALKAHDMAEAPGVR